MQTLARWADRNHPILLLVALLAHAALLFASISLNAVNWDEGWNFCVARNWVEHGHYGCSFDGKFTDARLSQGLLVVAPIAAGFKLFGFGIIEARVFQGLLTFCALVALYLLTRILAGRSAGIVLLLYLLGLSVDQRIHPMTLGGQGWGEMTVVFLITLGAMAFLALGSPGDRKPWSRYAAVALTSAVAFGVAMATKYQAFPFVVLGLVAITLNNLRLRDYRAAGCFIAVLLGALLVRHLIASIPLPTQADMTFEGTGVKGLLSILSLSFDRGIRLFALQKCLAEGWPYLAALLFLTWRARLSAFPSCSPLVRYGQSIFLLGSISLLWFLWYLGFSHPLTRYLGPALILGAPLFASALTQWWELGLRFRRPIVALLSILGICNIIGLSSFLSEVSSYNPALVQTANYLNTKLKYPTRIETYDSGLYFLLSQPYRYPPDQAHLAVFRNSAKEAEMYNPLESPANLFVMGPWSKFVFGIIFKRLYESGAYECKEIALEFDVCSRKEAEPAVSR